MDRIEELLAGINDKLSHIAALADGMNSVGFVQDFNITTTTSRKKYTLDHPAQELILDNDGLNDTYVQINENTNTWMILESGDGFSWWFWTRAITHFYIWSPTGACAVRGVATG
jgi:hypothetical protein